MFQQVKISFSSQKMLPQMFLGNVSYLYFTRLLGRFAPIFYFNCEHFLFSNIEKQKQNKKFADFMKKNFVDFENLL